MPFTSFFFKVNFRRILFLLFILLVRIETRLLALLLALDLAVLLALPAGVPGNKVDLGMTIKVSLKLTLLGLADLLLLTKEMVSTEGDMTSGISSSFLKVLLPMLRFLSLDDNKSIFKIDF